MIVTRGIFTAMGALGNDLGCGLTRGVLLYRNARLRPCPAGIDRHIERYLFPPAVADAAQVCSPKEFDVPQRFVPKYEQQSCRLFVPFAVGDAD